MSETEQIAGLTATVQALKDEVHGLRQDLKDQRDNFVPAREFIAWKTGLDREIADLKTGLANERAERKAQRIPPAVYVTALIGVLSLAATVIIWLAERS
ncbi:hypothetical protein [Demequina flava]|uniref:hypothetical protein n=1 Tax=Demequina flava TaxID=1095025 RepID=UPI00128E39E4|nr:hypothetical protein [Demequina flava]